jgi:shikimate dehydrogenase
VSLDVAAISGKTRVFCVLGHPAGHSLSPAMHNAALREMGLDGVYVAFDVAPDGLTDAIRGLHALGCGGINCTIPHKEAVLPLLDELSTDAQFIGAVNTVQFDGEKRLGHNTDAPGFLAALRAEAVDPAGARAIVLGAGGSARAILTALVQEGASVTLSNRTGDRAEELAQEFNEKVGRAAIRTTPWQPEALRQAVEAANLLVNTTSLGMSPQIDGMPPIPAEAFHSQLFVYDLIYNPLETRLLREARMRGSRGVHGAGMLAHQGAQALWLWTGQTAPAGLMERVVLDTLEKRAARDTGERDPAR